MQKLLDKVWIITLLVSLVGFVLLFAISADLQAEEGSPGDEAIKEKTTSMPMAIKTIAAAIAIGLTALATGLAQSSIGAAGIGAIAENPKSFGSALIFLVIPETMVIFGFVIAAIILLVV